MSLSGLTCLVGRTRCLIKTGKGLFSYINSDNLNNHRTRSYFQTARCALDASIHTSTVRRSLSTMARGNGLIFRQLFDKESWTYTYILADEDTKEAVIIDPVIDQVERDIKMIEQNDLKLKFAVNTHVHADHITGSGVLKRRLPGALSAISKISGGQADMYLDHGAHLTFGRHTLEARSTPGHTNGCMSFVLSPAGMAFTGDALLIRGCGRTDFQEGDPGTLYESVWREILSLPDSTLLYPAHDYVGLSVTSVKEEKVHNPRLSKSKEAFIDIMKNLNLPYPKQIDKSLPANLVCGLQESVHVQ